MTQQPDVSTVRYSVEHGVAHIEIDRPQASNAVDLPTALALDEAVRAAGADGDVRAVLLAGNGARFCAGGDVAAMVATADPSRYVEELALALDGALQRLGRLDKPVVAAVQGAVAGAGLAVVLSCDLVVAGSGTRFVAAYSGVGLTPDCGLSWLLPRAVGQPRALELVLTNRVLTAQEALSWGLVADVVDDGQVRQAATTLVQGLADGPAWAHGQARKLIRTAWEAPRDVTGRTEARTIAEAVGTADARERLQRFVAR
jgi:2-(1,2-epoxy-1,2-dihydrophenyl)acetyl-CoA isomerase